MLRSLGLVGQFRHSTVLSPSVASQIVAAASSPVAPCTGRRRLEGTLNTADGTCEISRGLRAILADRESASLEVRVCEANHSASTVHMYDAEEEAKFSGRIISRRGVDQLSWSDIDVWSRLTGHRSSTAAATR